MKGAKVRVEPKTIHATDIDAFAYSLHYHNSAVKVTKSAFYSNHITLTGPITISFLKNKALLNTDCKK